MDHYLKKKMGLPNTFFSWRSVEDIFQMAIILCAYEKVLWKKKCALITCMYMKHNMIFKIIRTRKKIHYPCFC